MYKQNEFILTELFRDMFHFRKELKDNETEVALTSPQIGLSSYDLYMFYCRMERMTDRKMDCLFGEERYWTISWIAATLADAGIRLERE
ncbi:MAG: hypothetical protein IJP92_10535 [Lachnospiraceae bacterium]|nr:hypothetical protein [Lachnospiraceae bacterium]